ncbi:MAG: TspO/MBR family protein [Pseudomonadota bacterium]
MRGLRPWLGLAGWLAVTFAAAGFGAQFSSPAWYESLQRPPWSPPSAVFGPVWTMLFLLMALAAWLVWRAHGFAGARMALSLYLLQLVFNAAWSWLFFGQRQIALGFWDIVLLWLLILATLLLFWRRRPLAGALLLPYLLWVGYAGALNFAIWRLNA